MSMFHRLAERSRVSVFSYLLLAMLVLTLVAACGSGNGDDAATTTGGETTTTATAGSGGSAATQAGNATETEDDATEETGADATASGGGAAGVGAIGACLQENTSGEMVTELRDGNTESAEAVYRTCLEDALPAGLVAQLDPVIQNAAECGSTAAQDLSDADVTAIEGGDAAAIQSLTQDTLACVSEELGIPLS